ncbi:DUF2238 domain-containing protein [Candidatus Pacearchaeota archaeon]|nr:DUF2238 domain-containing protein [Candidatus Pacearchaeota archaeon]
MKRGRKSILNYWNIPILLIMGFLIQFFIMESYTLNVLFSIIASLVFIFLGYYFWNKSFFNFFLFSLTAISFFVSLEVSFNIGFYLTFLFSLIFSLIFSFAYLKWKHDENYPLLLLISFIFIWIILGFNVLDRTDWILENSINVPFIIIIVLLSKWFRFSKLSYSLFYLFMFMNVIGSHYTYSEVPFGFWLEGFLGITRNHYDRIIHFSFGFLLAYPLREVYIRVGNYKGFWALMAPIIMVLGLSAVYELLEWWIAVIFGGDLGIAYLGSQGDIWDAQKDMFLAGFGSIITMFIVFIVLITYKRKTFISEIKDSLKVKKQTPLGEIALEKIQKTHR